MLPRSPTPQQRGQQRPLVPFALGFASALVCCLLLSRGWLPTVDEASVVEGEQAESGGLARNLWQPLSQLLPSPGHGSVALGRRKALAVIGVQTGFTTDPHPKYNYEKRRQQLRSTWFPPDQASLDRLEAEQGLVVRFVVGHSEDPEKEAAVGREAEAFGGFWRLPVQEAYLSLANKTLAFLRDAAARYDTRYIVKVDDDVYLRLDRVPHAVRQWADVAADYVGCMKTGVVIKSPRQRWYEPQHAILGGSDSSYFTHAWGPVYAVSGRVAGDLAALRPGSLRFFNNEDVTVGAWMLALNVTHLDDRRLCETTCSQSSLAVYDIPGCAGLCDPVKQLPELHNVTMCHLPTLTQTGGLPLTDPLFYFDRRPDPRWEARALAALKAQRRREAAVMQAQGRR